MNLASQLNPNNGVQVVLTANINIKDRLVNVQVSKVTGFKKSELDM